MPLVFPVSKKGSRIPVISDGYHMRSSGKFHYGVDVMYRRLENEPIGLPWGTKGYIMFPNTAVLAAHSGTVTKAETIGTGGIVRVVGKGIETAYMHMTNLAVKVGQFVAAGTVLGAVGDNPKENDPAHLHFELHADGERTDPEPFLKDPIYINRYIFGASMIILLAASIWLGYKIVNMD